jgi:hypothetical protein
MTLNFGNQKSKKTINEAEGLENNNESLFLVITNNFELFHVVFKTTFFSRKQRVEGVLQINPVVLKRHIETSALTKSDSE